MFIRSILIFLLISLVVIAQPSYQWTLKQSGSSLGGPIDYNRFNPNIVYYGSNNIIYKSSNKGESFTQTGSTVPAATKIKCIIVDEYNPGTLVVAIESSPNDKIYKTTDDGTNWILTNDEGQMSYFGIPITRDPSNPNILYTMIDTKFKKSTDFGSSWITIANNFGPLNAPCDIEVFPDTNIILIGDNGTGIFKSTDGGYTWSQKFSTSGEIPTIAIDFTHPGTAWATKWGGGGGFLKSNDYGETWIAQTLFNGINMWGVNVQPDDGNHVIAGCYSCNTSWRTKDGGQTWMQISISSTNYQYVIIDSMNQFAAQGNGFYKLESPFFNLFEITSLKVLIEGLFDGIVSSHDTITVELRSSNFPFNLVEQTKVLLNSNGECSVRFYNLQNGIPYYIVIKHRNSIETWSSVPQSFSGNQLVYDFTSAQNKAYGNNLKLVNGKWCIYSGDVNQDGFVNSTDVMSVFNDNVLGAAGYLSTDLNNDFLTEIGDLYYVFLNSVLGIQIITPSTFIDSNKVSK
jgi:photosystem II stability/assembly factor-like uncharacterized protein